jgi:hypothetical protein
LHWRPSYLRLRPLALRPRLTTGLPLSVLGLPFQQPYRHDTAALKVRRTDVRGRFLALCVGRGAR